MGFVAFTILFCGALAVVAGSECVVETAECIQFWEKIEPHKGLFETERELNAWCNKRSAFYDCLVTVLLAGKDGDVSHLPRNLLLSKLYAEDLCKPGSIRHRRYLNNAVCINQLNTEFCTSPEYLDIGRADDSVPSKSSLAEKTLDCIAASMIMNCGFDAGRLYRNMLTITRYNDEVCDVEASQSTLHDKMGAKDTKSKGGTKLSEVYYDLVDRLGNIPGQVDSVEMPGNSEDINVEASQSTLQDKMGAKDMKLKGGAELSKVYYDFVDRLGNIPGQEVNSVEMPGNSEEINESEGNSYEMITEAMKTALDRLDEDVEASQSTLHDKTGTKDVKSKGSAKLSKVYYDFDMLGTIPGQVDSVEMPGNSEEINVEASQSTLHDKMGAKDTELKGGAKLSKVYYDFVDRLGNIPGQVDSVEMPRNSEEIDESEGTNHEMITEAIKTALDRLDEGPEDLRNHTVIRIEWEVIGSSLYTPDVPKKTEIKPYRKYPLITEVYNGILFYNYSDHEYAVYWRQPDFTNVDKITCRHLQPSYMRGVVFQCIHDHRTKDPDCVSNETVHEPVTPELIRDIDPDVPYDSIVDFAHPRPEWMRSIDEAKEAKRLRDLMSSTTTESPEYSSTVNPEASTASTLLHVTETIVKASERFRDTGLGEGREIPDTHKKFNMIIPNHVYSELMSLFKPDPKNFKVPSMTSFQSDDQMYFYFFDPYPNSLVENLTCSRLVECHPRARGVFRCIAFPRKIEICEECGQYPPVDNLTEASGEEDFHSSEEVITLLFSGDEESETNDPSESSEQSTFYTESNYEDFKSEVDSSVLDTLLGDNRLESFDEVLSNNVDGFMNDMPEEASHLDFPRVQIVVLEQDSKSQYDDSSDYVPKLVYSVDDVKRIGDELISNRLESSDEVLSDNVDGFVKGMPEEASHLDFPTVQIVVLEQDSKSQYDDSSDYAPKLVYSVDDVKRIGDEPISELTLSADNYGLFNDNVILLQDAPDNIEDEYTFVDISDD